MEVLENFILPEAKSTLAHQTDALFWTVHIASLVLAIGLLGVMAYFVYKYRRKSPNEVPPLITDNHKLEVLWSVIPLLIVIIIFGWGYRVYINQQTIPQGAYEINVTGQQWLWQFQYANGARSNGELHVPAGRPVKLVMTSKDVIHSFFVPDYRIKQDVVPGRYTTMWFEAPEPGESQVYCAEYCGTDHSHMLAKVIVQKPEDFQTWLQSNAGGGKKPSDLAPAEWGKQLVKEWACTSCHSTDGSVIVGPSWKGVFGHEVHFEDGSSTKADENYIRESILEPQKKIVKGFPPVMNTYKGQLNDDQINAIIEYIKTLK